MTWRRIRKGETDHESLWLAVSTSSAVGAAIWLNLHLPLPQCGFHVLTGLPCPTCGLTRATRQLLHGNVAGAFHFNPLGVCVAGALVLFDIYAAVVLALRLPRLRFDDISPVAARRIRIATVSVILINWAWLIAAGV